MPTYKFQDNSGQTVEFNWSLPREPTDDDIDRIFAEREEMNKTPVQLGGLPTFETMRSLPRSSTPRFSADDVTDTSSGILGGQPIQEQPILGGRASQSLPQFEIPEVQLRPNQMPPRRPIGTPFASEIPSKQPMFAPPRMELPDFREGSNPAATRFFPEQEEAVFNTIGKAPIVGGYAEPASRFLFEGITSPQGALMEFGGGSLITDAAKFGARKLATRGAKKIGEEVVEGMIPATARSMVNVGKDVVDSPLPSFESAMPAPTPSTGKPRIKLGTDEVIPSVTGRKYGPQNVAEAKAFVKERMGIDLPDADAVHHANVIDEVLTEHGILPANKPTVKAVAKEAGPVVSEKATKTASGTAQAYKNGPEVTVDNVEKAKQIILNYEETAGAVKILKMTDDEVIRYAEALDPSAFRGPNGVVKASSPAVTGNPIVASATPPTPTMPNAATPEAAIEQLEKAEAALRMATKGVAKKSDTPWTIAWLAKEAINLPRSAWAMGDYAGALRQGKGLITRTEYWKSLPDMLRAGWSEKGAAVVNERIKNLEHYGVMMSDSKYNPGIAEVVSGSTLSHGEEQFVGTLLANIPSFNSMRKGILNHDTRYFNLYAKDTLGKPMSISRFARANNRAHAGFLNSLRAETMNTIINNYKKAGLDPFSKPELLEATAKFISSATGRGDLGTFEASAATLNKIGFAPKFVKSRFDQSVFGVGKDLLSSSKKVPNQVKLEILRSQVGIYGYWAALAGIAHTAGAEVNLDPTSSDFGKIIIGNTRLDLLSGLQQPLVATIKIASGLTTSATSGKTRGLGTSGFLYDREAEFGGDTGVDVAASFARSKASPFAGMIYDYFLKGTDYQGRPIVDEMTRTLPPSTFNPAGIDPDNYFARMSTPNMMTTWRELYNEDPEAMAQIGIPLTYLIAESGENIKVPSPVVKGGLGALATFGEGVQVFEPRATGQYAPKRTNRRSAYRSQYD